MTHVAAIQMDGRLGDVEYNLAHVKELLAEATGRGASVIAVPEFFTTTIALDNDDAVRACALPPENPALDLLIETATTHDALIGGSYLEKRADGDVYNCYTLVRPDGTVTRHDKDLPTMIENAYYVGGSTSGIHQTPAGSVGTAVCWETIRTQTVRRLHGKVDFLMTGSHWWTTPSNWWWGPISSVKKREAFREILAASPSALAKLLGVANMHASHCGDLHALYPVLPGRLLDVRYDTTLMGETQIVDNTGHVVAKMTEYDGPGVIDAEIDLTSVGPSMELPDRFWIPQLTPLAKSVWWHQNFVAKRMYNKAKHNQEL